MGANTSISDEQRGKLIAEAHKFIPELWNCMQIWKLLGFKSNYQTGQMLVSKERLRATLRNLTRWRVCQVNRDVARSYLLQVLEDRNLTEVCSVLTEGNKKAEEGVILTDIEVVKLSSAISPDSQGSLEDIYWSLGTALGIGLDVLDRQLTQCEDDADKAIIKILRQWRNGEGRGDGIRTVLAEILLDQGSSDFAAWIILRAAGMLGKTTEEPKRLRLAEPGVEGMGHLKNNSVIVTSPGAMESKLAVALTKQLLRKSERKTSLLIVVTKIARAEQYKQALLSDSMDRVGCVFRGRGPTDQRPDARVPLNVVMRENDVIILTAQILVAALDNNQVSFKDITVIIFDECHELKKDSPYTAIMNSYMVASALKEKIPLVLGVTSLVGVNSGARNKNQAIRFLCNLCSKLDAPRMFICEADEKERSDDERKSAEGEEESSKPDSDPNVSVCGSDPGNDDRSDKGEQHGQKFDGLKEVGKEKIEQMKFKETKEKKREGEKENDGQMNVKQTQEEQTQGGQKEDEMLRAVAEEISKLSFEELNDVQSTIRKKSKKSMGVHSRVRNNRTCDLFGNRFYCRECEGLICKSDDMRLVSGGHHVVIEPDILMKIEIKPSAGEDAKAWGGIEHTGYDIRCKVCGTKWGSVLKYKAKQLLAISPRNMFFKSESTKPKTAKRWRDVPFTFAEAKAEEAALC